MKIHKKYNLTKIINARGTFTPLGVSRSTTKISKNVANALEEFFLIDELQELASQKISQLTGANAGCVTHCTSSSISMAIAGMMTGTSSNNVALLPDTMNMKNKVIVPKGHIVNYGQLILQAIRLTGAIPIIVGVEEECTLKELKTVLQEDNVACLLLVSSRLVKDNKLNFKDAISLAKEYDIPTIIDAAAQDFRCKELLSLGADLILHSGQKYLLSPTAGILYGKKKFVDAVYANEKGIGRSMKASKESLIGVISAIDERLELDIDKWKSEQSLKVKYFLNSLNDIKGVNAIEIPDYTDLPFSRVCLSLDVKSVKISTFDLTNSLKESSPQIWAIDNESKNNKLVFELIPLHINEIDFIAERIQQILKNTYY